MFSAEPTPEIFPHGKVVIGDMVEGREYVMISQTYECPDRFKRGEYIGFIGTYVRSNKTTPLEEMRAALKPKYYNKQGVRDLLEVPIKCMYQFRICDMKDETAADESEILSKIGYMMKTPAAAIWVHLFDWAVFEMSDESLSTFKNARSGDDDM